MQLNVERPSFEQAREYIAANCKINRKIRQRGFYDVISPLKVFKKARSVKGGPYQEAIVSLLIPAGAIIYTGDSWNHFYSTGYNSFVHQRKMRASEAYVEKITDIGWGRSGQFDKKADANVASSKHDSSFHYRVGQTVQPKEKFSRVSSCCESGIHFFLNPHDAVSY